MSLCLMVQTMLLKARIILIVTSHLGACLSFGGGAHGLSQKDLAFNIESSLRHISRMENGRVL